VICRRATGRGPSEVRAWVHEREGELVVTWQVRTAEGWRRGGRRPLTRLERGAWWAVRRAPKVKG
jgi:hypothetical protein